MIGDVGLFDRIAAARAVLSTKTGVLSPWADSSHLASLSPLVLGDVLGLDLTDIPLTRGDAISIPAVSKARNLLVSTVAKFPLRALAQGQPVPNQPSFLYRTDNGVTPYERMAWTVDDLIFYGYSLWLVERGERTGDGRRPILKAEWCPIADWKITDGHILVNDEDVDDDQVILFNSPFEGLLNIANATMRGARDQEQAWIGRARNPIPLIELHQTDDAQNPDEVEEFVKAWGAARRARDGAIGYTPPGLEIRTHGTVAADLMVEGRNAVRTDIGSFLNVRASMLDGTMGVDSLTYSTTAGERNSFYEFDLPFWTDPIEARLSMDDVVPRGQVVRFDKYEAFNAPSPTGPTVED